MNIEQFLEEEYKNPQTQSLKDHDTRLINFILSEVEKEVEKWKVFGSNLPLQGMKLIKFDEEHFEQTTLFEVIDKLKLK